MLEIVMTTVDSPDEATRLAQLLVRDRLAACVQVLPITSHYVWDGELQQSGELLLLVKTTEAVAAAARIAAEHRYEVPEIVTLPVSSVNEPYLAWARS